MLLVWFLHWWQVFSRRKEIWCLVWGNSEKKDYYEFLGVKKSVPDRDTKKTFGKLAMKYYPDKNKEKTFKEIAEGQLNYRFCIWVWKVYMISIECRF